MRACVLQSTGGNTRLAHMVVHRLERLSAKEQLIARHASVVGLVIPLRVLLAVLPPPVAPFARYEAGCAPRILCPHTCDAVLIARYSDAAAVLTPLHRAS